MGIAKLGKIHCIISNNREDKYLDTHMFTTAFMEVYPSIQQRDSTAAAASLGVCARTHEFQTLRPGVYRCLHGLGPEYLSENLTLFSEIHSLQRLRSYRLPVPTSRFLPHAGLHLATAHFRSQELGHGTRYRPVSLHFRAVSLFIPATSENFLFQRQLRG